MLWRGGRQDSRHRSWEGISHIQRVTAGGVYSHTSPQTEATLLPGPRPARVTVLAVATVWLTGLPKPAVGTLLPTALAKGARWAGLVAPSPVPARFTRLTVSRVWRAGLLLLAVAAAMKRGWSQERCGGMAPAGTAHRGLQDPGRDVGSTGPVSPGPRTRSSGSHPSPAGPSPGTASLGLCPAFLPPSSDPPPTFYPPLHTRHE